MLDHGLITKAKIDQITSRAKETGQDLYETLVQKNMVDESEFLRLMSELYGYPCEEIDRATVDYKIANLIPEKYSREHYVLALFQLGNTLTVAIGNPFQLSVIEELEMLLGFEINPILTRRNNIDNLFKYCYSKDNQTTEDSSVMHLFDAGMKLIGEMANKDEGMFDLAQEAPIAKLVDMILKQSIEMKASDIHIESEEKVMKVRYRIDGLLHDMMMPPKKLEPAIISRLKILTNMDITETRKPQDGRLSIRIKDRDIDFRVSTVRTVYGEKVVLRILDKAGSLMSIEKMGLSPRDYKAFNSMISSTSGVMIVCGPTGSGKTTTLYGALARINTPDVNIVTIEDPVEYSLPGINQIPVNHQIGVDFARGLSAIVRQDPDVIMVGEIRDLETASIAIQAALTGHMVFSTLHTRNAPGAITRMIDMGVQPFLVTSAVIGVVAQRLVRQICSHCKKPEKLISTAGNQKISDFLNRFERFAPENYQIFRGQGCKYCDSSGYKGRIGIYEVMIMDDEVRKLTLERASSEHITEAAQRGGMTTMLEDGMRKVLEGSTTLEEVMRVVDL